MKRLYAIVALMGAAVMLAGGSLAQTAAVAAATSSLTPAQMDQLVAPVALYSDALLADVLTASTYPLEVVEARRWTSDPANAALKGDALTAALDTLDWSPSVKALVPFPEILQMMDDHLDWTERLGEAFLAQQGDVMDAVQRLRHRAEIAGTLKSLPQQTVANDGDDVTISPPSTEVIYIPTYDPWCAYGVWPYPTYPPYYYSPWPGFCGPDDYAIAFDAGVFLPFAFWDWGYFDWRGHHIRIRHDRYEQYHGGHEPAGHAGHEPAGDVWNHNPVHRVGVPYRDQRNVQQFEPAQNDRQSYRGYEGATERSGRAPAFEDFSSGRDTQMQSQRGQSSRGFGGAPRGFGGGRGGGRGRP